MRDDADAAPGGDAVANDIVAEDADVSGGGSEESADASDGGCFAGAVRAEESEDFARAGGEGDVLDRRGVAVLFSELFDFNHWLFLGYGGAGAEFGEIGRVVGFGG